MARKRTERSTWAENRRGFKHELILSLFDLGYTYLKANEVVEITISCIKEALRRKEEVVIDGFGAWRIAKAKSRRVWRFAKVIEQRTNRVVFHHDKVAFSQPSTHPAWKPHPGWQKTRKTSSALTGRKLAEFQRQQAEEREQALLNTYSKTIVNFFMDPIRGEDWTAIWRLRLNNSQWYWGEFEQTHSVAKRLRSIQEAEQVIKETEPPTLPRDRNDRVIDLLRWYARWTAQIDVDRKLFELAERQAREQLRTFGG